MKDGFHSNSKYFISYIIISNSHSLNLFTPEFPKADEKLIHLIVVSCQDSRPLVEIEMS